MTVCKYMSPHWGLDYLSNWHLKITPPAEFNDPFELKAPSNEVFPAHYFERQFDKVVHDLAVDELAKALVQHSPQPVPHEIAARVAAALTEHPGSARQSEELLKLRDIPNFNPQPLLEMSAKVSAIWPALLESCRQTCLHALPAVNAAMQSGLSERLPSMLGVLCLSRDLNQPLMWAHYADSHQGLMIEFDDEHTSLNRRRSLQDEFGFLQDAVYSKRRIEMTMDAIESKRFFEVFALTKSSHWAYEEEVRFVWPLEHADKTIDAASGKVYLIHVPGDAVVSVTLGCKASQQLEDDVLRVLSEQEACRHIKVHRAHVHATEFELVYKLIGAGHSL
jgi:hypothetical protein